MFLQKSVSLQELTRRGFLVIFETILQMHGLLLRMVPVPKKSTWRKTLKSNPMTGITCVAGEKKSTTFGGKGNFCFENLLHPLDHDGYIRANF